MSYLTLKWGTLKRWDFSDSEKGKALLKEYNQIGSSAGAMMQKDTQRQKEIICELIDECSTPVYLDWDGKEVSKEEAKKYVLEYNSK